MKGIDLSIQEIKNLAQFAGFVIDESALDEEDLDTEITIVPCPPDGLDDDGVRRKYRMIAFYSEYPEEGSYGLGAEIKEGQ